MKENEKVCECGSVHHLETQEIVVEEGCFILLLKKLVSSKNKKFLIFNSLKDSYFCKKIYDELNKIDKSVEFINLINCQSTEFVSNLEDKGQEVVVAIGDENLISAAKYYSYMYDSELFIFPVGEFLDYTFSKFARLNDGLFYDFYLTKEPSHIYVDCVLNSYNELQMQYIASKYIALFDLTMRECVYNESCCKRAKNYIKKTLLEYSHGKNVEEKILHKKNIWVLIKLGQAMSFFSQTKCFFGGDKAIVDLLQAQKNISHLQAETIALKLVKNLYASFYKSFPSRGKVDLNKHLHSLSELLNISTLKVVNKLADSELIVGNDEIVSKFSNCFPYLKGVFANCLKCIFEIEAVTKYKNNFIQKLGFSRKRIEQSFALASSIYTQPCSLHLFSSFGYLDKLL